MSNITPNIDDVNIPLENPRLKGLLVGRHQTGLENMGKLIQQEIMNHARFLVFVVLDNQPEDNGDGTVTFQQKSTMRFPNLTSEEGKAFQPVFTDWMELQEWAAQKEVRPNTITMSAEDVFSLVRGSEVLQGAVINPFTDNFILEEEMIADWQ